MIEFKNVSKTYSTGTEAVHDASFKIDKGDFAFLVGQSGSGKSTLIKLILKEEEPSSGTIIINGKDTTFLKPKRVPYLRRSMGVVFQDFRLLSDKTVYDNRIALLCKGGGICRSSSRSRAPRPTFSSRSRTSWCSFQPTGSIPASTAAGCSPIPRAS